MEADNPEDICKPFKKYVETRWLARAQVIRNIVKNWDSLLAYFSSISDIPMEQMGDVQTLCETFKDRSKYALLVFLLPIIEQFERLNAMFQGTSGAEKAYEALLRVFNSLKHRVMTSGPRAEKRQMKDVEFGPLFDTACHQYAYGKGDHEIQKVTDIRNRAWAFLLRLVEETEKRLPANIAVFQQMTFFSPAFVLSSQQIQFSQMPFIECVDEDELAELDEEFRQFRQVRKYFL
jgi:hypothetical protein